jgi:hypothetical protein
MNGEGFGLPVQSKVVGLRSKVQLMGDKRLSLPVIRTPSQRELTDTASVTSLAGASQKLATTKGATTKLPAPGPDGKDANVKAGMSTNAAGKARSQHPAQQSQISPLSAASAAASAAAGSSTAVRGAYPHMSSHGAASLSTMKQSALPSSAAGTGMYGGAAQIVSFGKTVSAKNFFAKQARIQSQKEGKSSFPSQVQNNKQSSPPSTSLLSKSLTSAQLSSKQQAVTTKGPSTDVITARNTQMNTGRQTSRLPPPPQATAANTLAAGRSTTSLSGNTSSSQGTPPTGKSNRLGGQSQMLAGQSQMLLQSTPPGSASTRGLSPASLLAQAFTPSKYSPNKPLDLIGRLSLAKEEAKMEVKLNNLETILRYEEKNKEDKMRLKTVNEILQGGEHTLKQTIHHQQLADAQALQQLRERQGHTKPVGGRGPHSKLGGQKDGDGAEGESSSDPFGISDGLANSMLHEIHKFRETLVDAHIITVDTHASSSPIRSPSHSPRTKHSPTHGKDAGAAQALAGVTTTTANTQSKVVDSILSQPANKQKAKTGQISIVWALEPPTINYVADPTAAFGIGLALLGKFLVDIIRSHV